MSYQPNSTEIKNKGEKEVVKATELKNKVEEVKEVKAAEDVKKDFDALITEATRERDWNLVKALKQEKNKERMKDLSVNDQLIKASLEGNLELVKNLVEKQKAVVNYRVPTNSPFDYRGLSCASAIGFAARNGHVDVVKYLVSKGGLTDQGYDHLAKQALLIAVKKGQLEVVEYLLGIAEFGSKHLKANNEDGYPLLIIAAQRGHLDVVKHLLERKNAADMNTVDNTHRGSNALIWAARYGHVNLVKYLLTQAPKKFDVNFKNKLGNDALFTAASYGKTEVCRYLLSEAPIKPEVSGKGNSGGTPLLAAAQGGHAETVKYLLTEAPIKANINEVLPECGSNALLMAAKAHDTNFPNRIKYTEKQQKSIRAAKALETVKFLIEEFGADVNFVNLAGNNALAAAASEGFEEVTQYLMTKTKVDAEVESKSDKLPAWLYVILGNDIATLKQMFFEGTTKRKISEGAFTHCLYQAAMQKKLNTVKFLIENAKEILKEGNLELHHLQICLEWALLEGDTDAVKYLLTKSPLNKELYENMDWHNSLDCAAPRTHRNVHYLIKQGAVIDEPSAIANRDVSAGVTKDGVAYAHVKVSVQPYADGTTVTTVGGETVVTKRGKDPVKRPQSALDKIREIRKECTGLSLYWCDHSSKLLEGAQNLLDYAAGEKVFESSNVYTLTKGVTASGAYVEGAAGTKSAIQLLINDLIMYCDTKYGPALDARALAYDGNTALHLAIKTGKVMLANMLLSNGARMDLTNAQGQTAYDLAIMSGNAELIKLVKEFKAKNEAAALEAAAKAEQKGDKDKAKATENAKAESVAKEKVFENAMKKLETKDKVNSETSRAQAYAHAHVDTIVVNQAKQTVLVNPPKKQIIFEIAKKPEQPKVVEIKVEPKVDPVKPVQPKVEQPKPVQVVTEWPKVEQAKPAEKSVQKTAEQAKPNVLFSIASQAAAKVTNTASSLANMVKPAKKKTSEESSIADEMDSIEAELSGLMPDFQ